MRFRETSIPGAWLVTQEPIEDERGQFARTFCATEFASRGLTATVAQSSVSYNRRARTLRGMHYQAQPYPEAKLVTCLRGALFDVIVDLRRGSPTFARWFGFELREGDGTSLFAPEGTAHGFVTLVDDTAVHYQISEAYRPELARGVRFDDPAFGIRWPPGGDYVMSSRDRGYPAFDPERVP
jgi:dTDP-4-dehydrorhamnose 3,5-epimerase